MVKEVLMLVGQETRLYDELLVQLRSLFLKTRSPAYCTLRADVLMALHENAVVTLYSSDPCHKFTWCITACVREQTVDSKKARDMIASLEAVAQGSAVIWDIAMVLHDPYTAQTLAAAALRSLHECVNTSGLPADSEVLVAVSRLLALGARAWDLIHTEDCTMPVPPARLMTVFYPLLAALVVRDRLALVSAQRGVLDIPSSLWPWLVRAMLISWRYSVVSVDFPSEYLLFFHASSSLSLPPSCL